MRPISTAKAADELSPEPEGRVLLISASKPPTFSPSSRNDAVTPRTSALGVPNSAVCTLV